MTTLFVRASQRALLALALAALASTALSAQAQRLRVKMPAYPVEVALDTMARTRVTIDAPPAETFVAVRAVFEALKIPREYADSVNGQMGVLTMRSSQKLGGERLSAYFNCGSGLTGAYADSWRLTLAIVAYVQPAGAAQSTLGTGILAQAQDMGGASRDALRCGSSGLLEARIARMVKARLEEGARQSP